MKKLKKLVCLSLLLICLSITGAVAQTTDNQTAKKARIGLAMVKTTSVGEGLDAQQFSAGVQNSLSEYLKSPDVELVAIEAKLPSAIEAEAKEKAIDYLIYVTVAHKKGGGGFGKMFGAVAPVLGSVAPVAGMGGSVAGAIAGQVATTAIMTAATMSSNVKAKDSLQMDLTIQKIEPKTSVFAKTYKAKAKADGEDIITPIIEQMAQSIIDTAAGKATGPQAEKK